MGLTISTKQYMINPFRILVRLVLKWKFLELISRFCAILSAIGCFTVILCISLCLALSVGNVYVGNARHSDIHRIHTTYWHTDQDRGNARHSDIHHILTHRTRQREWYMGWLWLVGSIKLQVSFAKEPYKRDNILQKRPIISSILLTVATPYLTYWHTNGVYGNARHSGTHRIYT